MYKIVPYNDSLDLSFFYEESSKRGYTNNNSKKSLIDSIYSEKEHVIFILYYNNTPIGSIGAHSFPELGSNSYRIAARTCVFSNLAPTPKWYTNQRTLGTLNGLNSHQHVTSQFLIPACLQWTPLCSKLYITTNNDNTAKQKSVHTLFAPLMEKKGILKYEKDMLYRGSLQTIWMFDREAFTNDLKNYPRWELSMG